MRDQLEPGYRDDGKSVLADPDRLYFRTTCSTELRFDDEILPFGDKQLFRCASAMLTRRTRRIGRMDAFVGDRPIVVPIHFWDDLIFLSA